MFCSIECKISAQNRYHKYECTIIDELLTSGIMYIVLRMFLEGLALFDGSINKLENFVEQQKDFPTIFEVTSMDPRVHFLTAINLSFALDLNHETDAYEYFFMKNEELKEMWRTNQIFIKCLLRKFIAIAKNDVHAIGGWSLKQNQHQELIGNGCFLFSSLLNHSCAPNIRRPNIENKMYVIVSRPIPKGGQLFDSYRANFNSSPTTKRQETLMQDYGFLCDCEACSGDWPLNRNLQSINDELLDYAWNVNSEIGKLTRNELVEKLKECCEFIDKYDEHYPSAELIIIQECISQCLIALTKPANLQKLSNFCTS